MSDIERAIDSIKQKYKLGIDYSKGKDMTAICLIGEQAEVVIKALEKQIPKKPIKDKEQNIRYTSSYSCPACGGGFTGTGIADYCYHCGQKLEWNMDKTVFIDGTNLSEEDIKKAESKLDKIFEEEFGKSR